MYGKKHRHNIGLGRLPIYYIIPRFKGERRRGRRIQYANSIRALVILKRSCPGNQL